MMIGSFFCKTVPSEFADEEVAKEEDGFFDRDFDTEAELDFVPLELLTPGLAAPVVVDVEVVAADGADELLPLNDAFNGRTILYSHSLIRLEKSLLF